MPQQSPPSAPNAGESASSYLQTLLRYTPQLLQSEYNLRGQYDPRFIEQQQGLQSRYGPNQYAQQLQALDQLNPYFRQVYSALGNNVLQGLSPNNPYVRSANQLALQTGNEARLGAQLDPAFQQQLQGEIRAAQEARGNTLGNAAVSGEVLYEGRAGQDLYNQRLQRAESAGQYAAGQRQVPLSNAGQFLSTTSPIQQVGQIQPVQAPDAFRLFNPNAINQGIQLGQQNYQNALAAYSMNQGQGSGWGSMIGGALGTAAGAYFGGMGGASLGGSLGSYAGGQVGGYFSDALTKENIKYLDKTTEDGIPLAEFNYIGDKRRWRGVIAQDVLKVRPDAVFTLNNLLGVWYDKLGLPAPQEV